MSCTFVPLCCLCAPVAALLFSATLDSFENSSIIIRTLTTGIVETILLNPSEGGFPPTGVIYGMDVDVEGRFVYYADRTSSTLMNVPLRQLSSTSDQRRQVLDGVKAWGLAYDWVTGHLYWTEDEYVILLFAVRAIVFSILTLHLFLQDGVHKKTICEWLYSKC